MSKNLKQIGKIFLSLLLLGELCDSINSRAHPVGAGDVGVSVLLGYVLYKMWKKKSSSNRVLCENCKCAVDSAPRELKTLILPRRVS